QPEAALRTSKVTFMDLGAGIAIASGTILLFLVFTKVKTFQDFKNNKTLTKTGTLISANLVWLILLPGTYWYYIFRGARGDYPPFADSIGIPLMTQIPFYLFLLIPLNIFMLRSEERRVGKDFRFGFMLCDVRMIYLCTF